MIKFYREKLDLKLYEEMLPLLKESMEEVYMTKENTTLANSMNLDDTINSKVNFKFFLEKENQGLFNVCTMRDGNRLVGYYSTIFNYHAQSKDLLVAETQSIYVKKEARGINSVKFMKFTEEVLKKRGVKLLYFAINPALKQERLMEYMGFSVDEIVYSKGL